MWSMEIRWDRGKHYEQKAAQIQNFNQLDLLGNIFWLKYKLTLPDTVSKRDWEFSDLF